MKRGQYRFSENKKNYRDRIWNQKKRIRSTLSADTNNSEQFILFLIWPFLALINCIKNRNSPWAKNIFWLFCIYYGYTFIIIGKGGEGSDAVRYAESFIALEKVDITFTNFFDYLYSEETSYVDIIQPLINFILSRFTSNPKILFATFGLIFGYFYSRNLWYLFDKIGKKTSIITGLYILIFALLCPIWSINGFRFWTATQIFIFGVLPYLIEGKKKGILIAATSIFVHFTFIFPVLILLIYSFTGNKRTVFFILFIFTSLISELDFEAVRNYASLLPSVFQSKVDTYVYDDALINQLGGLALTNWYIKYNGLLLRLMVYSYLTVIYLKSFTILKSNLILMRLYCFTLLIYSYCNIANLMPQGVRFFTIGNLLFFFFIINYFYYIHNQKIIEILKKLSILPAIIIITVSFRRGFDFAGILTVFGNPFFAPFLTGDIPLIDLIK